MNAIIRKISVGKDYPNGSLHYQVGGKVRLLNEQYRIELIKDRLDEGVKVYDIFVTSDEGLLLWKTIKDVPVVLENDINFE